MARYRFSPFDVEEQCAHARRSQYHDSESNGPALVFLVNGRMAGLRSNGIPRLIDDDPLTFDIIYAMAQRPAEVTKNLRVCVGLEAFEPLFCHEPIDIFIDIDNDGSLTTVGATVPKAEIGHIANDDMAPG